MLSQPENESGLERNLNNPELVQSLLIAALVRDSQVGPIQWGSGLPQIRLRTSSGGGGAE